MNRQKKAIAAAITGNCIFGFSFMFSKIALNELTPFALLAIRFCVAFLCMNILVVFRVAKLSLKGKNVTGLLWLGISQPIIYFILENYGIAMTNSVISGAFIAMVPAAGALMGRVWLKEPFNWKQGICTACSVFGVMLISGAGKRSGTVSLTGILCLCGAVLSAGLYNLLSRKTAAVFTAFERTYVMFAMGCVFFSAAAAISQGGAFFTSVQKVMTNSALAGSVIYLGIISSVVAFFLLNYAVNDLPVTKATSFTNLTGIVSVAAGYLLLKEEISPLHFVGCVMVLVSIYGVHRFGAEN